ncbi:MAG: sensor histidine kinase [Betaproteobacteria bacterium]|nr:sensor histidine kinase [Betaproteobacteria bacterium]
MDNLIDNALRYTPPGSQVDIAWGTDGSHAWIAVEDDGPGIALPDQDRVFERFERGSNANQTIGSGLGLAIARGVAVLHGGSLELEARPDGQPGCRFVMQLPSA